MTKAWVGAALFLALSTSAVVAQQEPWGANVPGWKFTQASEAGGIANCRAMQGDYLVSLSTNGRTYLSMSVPAGLPKGWYREGRASVIIGGNAEPVDAEVTNRLLFYIDSGNYPGLIRARGYQWRIMGPKGALTGTVSFSGDIANVIAALRACVKANTVAAQPQPAPQAASSIAKWSGMWSWVRPLEFNFSGGPAAPPPGPQDVTVRKRENVSFELLPNNHVKICFASSPCSVFPFTQNNGIFEIDYHSGIISVVTDDQGRSLNGQFWWQKQNRMRTTPDAMILVRQ
ncbi:hypothetical protein ABLE93_20275 [Xanthobacter sp. KR7-65]|uniref:hypothetical protein n=1 Tax=Xanthobacter sp. KR7-65 TaxID=3156612 RepID=UPI0032B52023